MRKMKTLTVNGKTYTVDDPDAAHIDDTAVGAAAWSSRNIVDKLCPGFSESGAVVSCEPVEGYPLSVVSAIEAVQEGSGDPRPVTSIDVSTRGTTLIPGYEYGVVTGGTDLTEGKRYKLAVNAKNASGERVKLEAAEVYDKNGTYSYTITTGIGDYDVEFSMDLDPENTSGRVQADIRLYFAEEVDDSSLWQYDEGGDRLLVEGAYVLSEYDRGNVRPIIGFDSVQLRRGGKNLLPYPYADTTCTRAGITFTDNGDSTITVNGTATHDTTFYLTNALSLPESVGLLVMSGCPAGGGTSTYMIMNVMSGHTDVGSGYKFKYQDNHKRWCIKVAAGTTVNNLVFKPQIELGEVATPYEPYRGDTFTAQLGQTVGKGTYDWNTGELKITHDLIRLTSDMKWVMTGSSNPNGIRSFYVNENTENARDSQKYPVQSSHYINNYNWTVGSVTYENAIKILNSRIYLTDARFTDLASFKAFLDEENVQLMYTLKEPVTYQFDPAQILALSGENTLTSDTGDTTVSGKADPAALFDKLISAIVAMGGNV